MCLIILNKRLLPQIHRSHRKACCNVPEAVKLLGYSRNFGYELARRSELPIIRFVQKMQAPRIVLKNYMKGGIKEDGIRINIFDRRTRLKPAMP